MITVLKSECKPIILKYGSPQVLILRKCFSFYTTTRTIHFHFTNIQNGLTGCWLSLISMHYVQTVQCLQHLSMPTSTRRKNVISNYEDKADVQPVGLVLLPMNFSMNTGQHEIGPLNYWQFYVSTPLTLFCSSFSSTTCTLDTRNIHSSTTWIHGTGQPRAYFI